ncbi:hypothetical protein CA833_22020 [Novosphingobium sp. KA1]|nr:hypothetical protein CA833_22020 [Novosphingobium sp. KA1]
MCLPAGGRHLSRPGLRLRMLGHDHHRRLLPDDPRPRGIHPVHGAALADQRHRAADDGAPAMIARRLRRDTHGATLIEFAIVGPVLIFMLIGLIETGRFLWSQHVLKDVAYATVRCMSVSSDCATSQTRLAYAANRAANEGLRVASSNVTIAENTACKGLTGANRVAITIPYSSALTGFVPGAPTTLSAEACFPVLPSED